MAYVLRYSATVLWVGPNGVGMNSGPNLQGVVGPTQGPRLVFFNASAPASNTFTSSDITSLLTSMTTDLSAQMNATPTITRVQSFASGGN